MIFFVGSVTMYRNGGLMNLASKISTLWTFILKAKLSPIQRLLILDLEQLS